MRRKKKLSLTIRNEIFLLSFLFLSIVSLIFTGILFKMIYDHSMESARNSLRQCNEQIVTYTEGLFHENASVLELLAKNPSIIYGGRDPAVALAIYDVVRKNNTNITYLYSGYSDGRLYINGYAVAEDFDPTSRPWYKAAEDTDGVARLVYKDVISEEWMFSQSTKLIDGKGNMAGVISMDYSNENISRQLSAKYQYESQRSYIIDSNGTVLIHPEEKYINDSLFHYMGEDVWNDVFFKAGNYGEYMKDGIKVMLYYEQIPETEFIVITAIDASEVTAPVIRSLQYLLLLVICVSIALGFVLSHILIRRFAKPIIALENRIRRVADGCSDDRDHLGFSNVEINGIADSIEIIIKNMAKREEQHKAAEYLSFHDSMTGVYNRRFFMEELSSLHRKRYYPLCIICCDINGLKLVNDVFGHDAGDRLIKKVAGCLEKSCRTSDTLARMGGDEFSIIMPHKTVKDAEIILEEIRKALSKEVVCGVQVSASLGYAVKEKKEESFEETLQRADKMMYADKMKERAQIRRRMEKSMIAAAEKEGVVKPVSEAEDRVLTQLARSLCPASEKLLKQSYRLRNIGLCAIFQAEAGIDEGNKRHTETGYRVLCMFDEYKNVAPCVLHSTEHWDGSGLPSGLAGSDIPLISRVTGVADAYFAAGEAMDLIDLHREWYDPEIVSVLKNIVERSV